MDHLEQGRRYGTTSLDQRSRSPSPTSARRGAGGPGPRHHYHQQPHQHSYPVLVTRRIGRRLPPTPNKPSTLQLKAPANINFPKLNASPTHGPLALQAAQHQQQLAGPPAPPPVNGPASQSIVAGPGVCPLSFEQAVAMGRGGRLLPSPVPNGYKPQVCRAEVESRDLLRSV